jgi:hypothetical protein
MSRSPQRIVFVLFALAIALQFIPVDRGNPSAIPAKSIYAAQSVPANVHAIFDRSCNDCHNNQTRWPWYSYVAPVSWVIANDVHEARRKMNFSNWGDYSLNKQNHELEEICNELHDGEMPDSKYVLIHRNAKVTQEESEAVCQWTSSLHH